MKAERRITSAAFWAYLAVATVIVTHEIGPRLEAALFPINVDQKTSDVVRWPSRLCWLWSRNKVRPAWSDRIDVLIEADGDRIDGTVYVEDTGEPWHRGGARSPSRDAYRLCTALPPSIAMSTPVRVELLSYYAGWHDLWRVPSRLPDVVDPSPP